MGNIVLEHGCICTCHRKKHFETLKNLNKNLSCTYQYIIEVSWKTDIFWDQCKKTTKNLMKSPFQPQFLSFYTWHKKHRFYVKRLCEHIEWQRCTCETFCPDILKFQNLVKMHFNNREHMLRGTKTPPPTTTQLHGSQLYVQNRESNRCELTSKVMNTVSVN